MADKDPPEELVPIVEGEDTEGKPEKEAPPTIDEGEGEGEDEGEDERLGTSEDDDDVSPSQSRNKKRREQARLKREQTERELEMLRQQNRDLAQRLGAVEGHALQTNEQQIEARFAQVQSDIQQAEAILAKATEDGQGEYAVQALRIRDAAKAEADRLAGLRQQLQTARETPRVDPRVATHAQEWMRDNPWYDPQARDEVSQLTKRIDSSLASEGYDPAHRGYWEELTKRVTQALKPADGTAKTPRNAPPMGNSSEHAPVSTRRSEIRVTPERKAAMIEAGVWDDPERRQRVLREYRDYDKAQAR
jgi:hypothetical protein